MRQAAAGRLNLFERYLSLWVGICMLVGVTAASCRRGWWRSCADGIRRGSQINVPIAVLIWLMIIPMMMKVDFASIGTSASALAA